MKRWLDINLGLQQCTLVKPAAWRAILCRFQQVMHHWPPRNCNVVWHQQRNGEQIFDRSISNIVILHKKIIGGILVNTQSARMRFSLTNLNQCDQQVARIRICLFLQPSRIDHWAACSSTHINHPQNRKPLPHENLNIRKKKCWGSHKKKIGRQNFGLGAC